MSALEDTLFWQIQHAGLPLPQREFRFHPGRQWRFDLCFPDIKLAVECEGGIWTHGAHNRGKHFTSDCLKYNQAVLDGFRVLRFTTDMVQDGSALKVIEQAIYASPP